MKHSKGIDFLIVSFKRLEYIELAVYSIHKYVDYPYKITIIDNSNQMDELNDLFEGDKLVNIIKGPQNGIWEKSGDGSKNHSLGLTLGMKNTDKEYICFFDNDAIFLNDWVDRILPRLDDAFFISNRFDRGIAREMFMIFKREQFKEHNLYPDVSHVDSAGNITKYAQENELPFFILGNSCFNEQGYFHRNSELHLLDLPHGEQVYVDDVPFFYHYGRGTTRDEKTYEKWIKETKKYLEFS
tara:strand:+ start:38 stop:760 length:723 start_codon:yes stop_codon:yes gene_type:complete